MVLQKAVEDYHRTEVDGYIPKHGRDKGFTYERDFFDF